MSGWEPKWFGELLEWMYQLKGEKLMKKVKDDEEGVLWSLPVFGIVLLVCVLFQVFEVKDGSLLREHRRGSVVKSVPKEPHISEILHSLFDKEDNK